MPVLLLHLRIFTFPKQALLNHSLYHEISALSQAFKVFSFRDEEFRPQTRSPADVMSKGSGI